MDAARSGKPVILVLMLLLTVSVVSGAICSQLSVQPVFAEPPDPCFGNNDCPGNQCRGGVAEGFMECCWDAPSGDRLICQFCAVTEDGELLCDNPKVIKGTIAPPPSGVAPPPPPGPGKGGPGNVLPEGVFEGPTTPPPQQKTTPEIAPLPPTCPPGQVLDEDTNLCFRVPQEQAPGLKPLIPPITTEEAPQAAPPPTCPTGQELDEDTNLCVPVTQEQGDQQPEEPEEQSDQDDEQSPEDGDSSEGNNNGDSQSNN